MRLLSNQSFIAHRDTAADRNTDALDLRPRDSRFITATRKIVYRSVNHLQTMSLQPSAPFWTAAFRPFFLLASMFAAFAVLIWVAVQHGHVIQFSHFNPVTWHAHEMIYGYGLAIIGSFLLTAAKNWTNLPSLGGWRLQVLVGVWLLGRLAPLFLAKLPWLWALVDLSFAPLLFAALMPYLTRKGQKENLIFLAVLTSFFCGNLLVHLDALHITNGLGQRGLWLGIDTIVLTIVVMAGRTVPFFMQRAVQDGLPARILPGIEKASVVLVVLFAASDLLFPHRYITALVAFVAAGVLFARWIGWRPLQGLRHRLLWVIFVGYLWLVIGFVLRGLAVFDLVAPGLAVHAIAVGTIGLITYAMISRIGLGHTGRAIAVSNTLLAGYVLITCASLARVALPLIAPGLYSFGVQLSGVLWAAAFILLAVLYAPLFVRPRVGG